MLFYNGPVSSTKDIEFAFKRCVNVKGVEKQNVHGERGRQLRYILHQLMLKQQHHLVSQASTNDDLLFNRVDGSTVETVCPCGAFKTVDDNPRFTCARAGGYVMRTTQRYKSEQCSEKKPDQKNSPQRFLKPVSSDLEGVMDLKECLRAEKRRNGIYLHRALLRKKGEGPQRPTVVSLWCCPYKEKTKVGGIHANELTRRGTYISMTMPNGPMVMFGRSIVLEKPVALAVLAGEDLSQLIQTLLSSAIANSQHSKSIMTSTTWPSKQPCWMTGYYHQPSREYTGNKERRFKIVFTKR